MRTENVKINELFNNYMIDEGNYSFIEFVQLSSESDEGFFSWVLGEDVDGWNLTPDQQQKWEDFLSIVNLYNEEATEEHDEMLNN